MNENYETCGFCGGAGFVYGSMYDSYGYQRFHEPPQLVCEYCGGCGQCEYGSILAPAAPREAYER